MIGKSLRNGFTVVEMLMVVAIIAILATIVTSAATAAVRSARERRADASRQVLEAGLAAFQMDKDEWPKAIEDELEKTDDSGERKTVRFLEFGNAVKCFQELALESLKGAANGHAYLDMSDVAICPVAKARKHSTQCVQFREAIKKSYNGEAKVSASSVNVAFGYQDPKTGFFRPFWIGVNVKTGVPFVSKCCEKCYSQDDGECNDAGCRECHDQH